MTEAEVAAKPKVGFYWMGTCGGCEESVVDLAERILDVVAAVDIVFWPVAMDFKKEDVEAMDDGRRPSARSERTPRGIRQLLRL